MASGYEQLVTMVAEIGRLVQDTSVPRKTSIKEAVNRAYDSVARVNPWPQLLKTDELGYRDDAGTITSLVSGEAEIPLPFGCGRIESLHLQNRDDGPITLVEPTELYKRAGSPLTTRGIPRIAAIVDTTAQNRRLSAAAAITASSSATLNNGTPVVRVHYRKTTDFIGHTPWQDLSGTFSTGVALGATVSAGYPIKMVALPAAWVGSFLLSSGGTDIVNIQSMEVPVSAVNATQQIISRPLLRVWPVPDTNYGLTLVWWAEPTRLTEDEDVPAIPVSHFLVERAAAEILRVMGNERASQAHEAEAQAYLRSYSVQTMQDRVRTSTPAGGNFIQGSGMRWRR